MDTLVNMPGLRAEALRKLKDEGVVPFSDVEVGYLGYVWNGVLMDAGSDREHPLFNAADFEIEILKVGKWEWLYAWLSPYHAASEFPKAMIHIASVLLGRSEIPLELAQRIHARIHKRG